MEGSRVCLYHTMMVELWQLSWNQCEHRNKTPHERAKKTTHWKANRNTGKGDSEKETETS